MYRLFYGRKYCMANKIKKQTSTSASDYSINTDPYINIASSTYTLPSNTVTIGAQGSTYNITGSGSVTGLWTSTNGTSASPWDYGSLPQTVKLGTEGIEVKESADIKLGDVSLKDFIKRIEERLALLTPNPDLEKEWTELKELGDKYRELEQHIKDKMKTWDILKSEDSSSK